MLVLFNFKRAFIGEGRLLETGRSIHHLRYSQFLFSVQQVSLSV